MARFTRLRLHGFGLFVLGPTDLKYTPACMRTCNYPAASDILECHLRFSLDAFASFCGILGSPVLQASKTGLETIP